MPLFTHQTTRTKTRKTSLGTKLKRLFNKRPKGGDLGDLEPHVFIDRFRIMFLRSMVVLMVGVAWWVAAPALFISLFPGFALYRQWITNYHTTISAVYQFWQVVPEILLFAFSILWTGGVLDMLFGNRPLEKVF